MHQFGERSGEEVGMDVWVNNDITTRGTSYRFQRAVSWTCCLLQRQKVPLQPLPYRVQWNASGWTAMKHVDLTGYLIQESVFDLGYEAFERASLNTFHAVFPEAMYFPLSCTDPGSPTVSDT